MKLKHSHAHYQPSQSTPLTNHGLKRRSPVSTSFLVRVAVLNNGSLALSELQDALTEFLGDNTPSIKQAQNALKTTLRLNGQIESVPTEKKNVRYRLTPLGLEHTLHDLDILRRLIDVP